MQEGLDSACLQIFYFSRRGFRYKCLAEQIALVMMPLR